MKSMRKLKTISPTSWLKFFKHCTLQKENKQKYEIFSLRSIDDHLHIFSSNVVDLSSYSILKDKLKDINEKDPDDLKKLYLEILKAGVFGEKGGAGLGLLQNG